MTAGDAGSALRDARTAIADRVRAAYPTWQVSRSMLYNATLPCVEVYPDPDQPIDYLIAGDATEWHLIVRAIVARNDAESAQDTLDAMLAHDGDGSMRAAILAANADSAEWGIVVTSADAYLEVIREGWTSGALACLWRVTVTSAYAS